MKKITVTTILVSLGIATLLVLSIVVCGCSSHDNQPASEESNQSSSTANQQAPSPPPPPPLSPRDQALVDLANLAGQPASALSAIQTTGSGPAIDDGDTYHSQVGTAKLTKYMWDGSVPSRDSIPLPGNAQMAFDKVDAIVGKATHKITEVDAVVNPIYDGPTTTSAVNYPPYTPAEVVKALGLEGTNYQLSYQPTWSNSDSGAFVLKYRWHDQPLKIVCKTSDGQALLVGKTSTNFGSAKSTTSYQVRPDLTLSNSVFQGFFWGPDPFYGNWLSTTAEGTNHPFDGTIPSG